MGDVASSCVAKADIIIILSIYVKTMKLVLFEDMFSLLFLRS